MAVLSLTVVWRCRTQRNNRTSKQLFKRFAFCPPLTTTYAELLRKNLKSLWKTPQSRHLQPNLYRNTFLLRMIHACKSSTTQLTPLCGPVFVWRVVVTTLHLFSPSKTPTMSLPMVRKLLNPEKLQPSYIASHNNVMGML